MNLVDSNWDKIFNKYDILKKVNTDGFFEITAKQINEFKEARLMTKFDHKTNLPKLFQDNKISILPLTRGSYILGNFDTYQDISYDTNVQNIHFSLPQGIESIDVNNLYSESSALHCAYVSGIINNVIEEEALPTISGRMSTGKFDFEIRNIVKGNSYPIEVTNSQCEIDGGYESLSRLAIIEAKNFTSDDFLIRQLFYPYRLWSNKITKEILPVFMTYSNDVFSFFIYKFINPRQYNSLKLVQQKNYIIAPEEITISDIYNLLITVKVEKEPDVPFPQADSFKRVVDLLGLLMLNDLTTDEITQNYSFDKRQTNYYTSAGMYLNLIEKRREGTTITYRINNLGRQIMGMRHKEKFLLLTKCILQHEVFNKVLKKYFDTASPVERTDIARIMNNCYLYNVNTESTVYRRAQTVNKWVEWILDLQGVS